MRFQKVIPCKRPNWIQRIWYRRLGLKVPFSTSTPPGPIARLLPYRWRRFHRWYARSHGYYWMPCVLCGRPYGGHEAGGSIPDPTRESTYGRSICSQCTRAGKSVDW